MNAIFPMAVSLVGLVCLGGCASPPPPETLPPTDFSLDVSVRAPDVPPAEGAELPVPPAHLRSGRYVLLPGGDLFVADENDGDAPSTSLPAYLRTLSIDEIRALWEVASRQIEAPASEPVDAADSDPSTSVLVAIRLVADGRSHVLSTTFAPALDSQSGIRDLVRSMAVLAWVNDAPPPPSTISPRRYYFGPDPYARYREESATGEQTDASQ